VPKGARGWVKLQPADMLATYPPTLAHPQVGREQFGDFATPSGIVFLILAKIFLSKL